MSYSDIKSLPLTYRRWYVERLVKHFKSINAKNKKISEPKAKTPDIMKAMKSEQSKQEDIKKIEKIFKKFS